MAFGAVQVIPPTSGGAARSGPDAWGGAAVEVWAWTQLNTDVGGTFRSGIEKIKAVIGSVTTAAANHAKTVGFSFSGQTITVVTDDNSGTESPVAGYVIVIGESR